MTITCFHDLFSLILLIVYTLTGVNKDYNKRSEIYRKKAGFGLPNKDFKTQYGIVRQHPQDHPEEHIRGKNYLEPFDAVQY